MRVTVFGATGKVGRLVVDQLLGDGHQVTAFVRNPAKLEQPRPRLAVQVGQLGEVATVRQAIDGTDAVISALGPTLKPFANGTALTEGTRAIVQAMKETGVRRFIGLATPSVPDERDLPTLQGRIIPLMAKTMFPRALAEVIGMSAAVAGSGLDWTLARITNPTDRPGVGTLRAGFLGHDKIGGAMTRTDIAAFLVAQLTDSTYLEAAPAISN
ncbi:putative NADH-flavin reductase [Kribbella sp. VKM Ac-2527]|uniref:Putative NADH-flavin reductase n=1 Tax=Kribbella caucasensis TaxID=2512215 RepID=A0A4R6KAL3_9ACTN|nr:NAD(P)H-binding protein [Kribbella sp. VKM Ac-2527]TDO46840.1 putative NADH-flavin reductase [Kribbella sp. VKM Ac-2527]